MPRMSREDATKLVAYLQNSVKAGWEIVTWNGLGFDFDVLAEESGCWMECADLALGHIDLMFHLFCIKGYPVKLDTVARGIGLPGKLEGVTGEMAPILWQRGEYDTVLKYVAQDVRTTLDIAKAGNYRGRIRWTSSRGNGQELVIPNGWINVEEAKHLLNPDTSWMSNPLKRSKFFEWIDQPDPRYYQTDRVAQYTNTGALTDGKPAPASVQETQPDYSEEELNAINALFELCESHSVEEFFGAPYLPKQQPLILEESGEDECQCPICMGAPNLDHIFLHDEDDHD